MTGVDDFLVVQLAGRLHFGAARGLARGGRLAGLLTALRLPKRFSALGRLHPKLLRYLIPVPEEQVTGNPTVGLVFRLRQHLYGEFESQNIVKASRSLAGQLGRCEQRWKFKQVFSFDTQALESFRWAEERGLRCVLEQCIAPSRTQLEVLELTSTGLDRADLERRRRFLRVMRDREEEEWGLAERIVCPSEYVAAELLRWGVRESKVQVVPYGFTPSCPLPSSATSASNSKPLSLLFVGAVNRRKGAPQLIEAMQNLDGVATLEMYGPMDPSIAPKLLPDNVRWHGPRPFAEIMQAYAAADVFILPSFLEGSATVVYEAMSFGLPSIVTPETGSVIEDGSDGILIERGSAHAIVAAVDRLANDESLRDRLGASARKSSSRHSLERYGDRLCSALD